MVPKHGYYEANRLLEDNFRSTCKISVACINIALNWPAIKSADGEALHSFGLYLTGCCNAMADVEYMEELDNTANMHAIIAKLPYKLRERWRTLVCGIQERQKRQSQVYDLVDFVIQQAKEALHPLFGDINDVALKGQAKGQLDERLQRTSGSRRGLTTAATITSIQEATPRLKSVSEINGNRVRAIPKSCLFCHGSELAIEQRRKMKKCLHKEKIDFLRAKGVVQMPKTGSYK